jgi:DNA polymerase (family 10)
VPVHNAEVAAVFDEIADLLEIQGANAFRIRACRNAARNIGDLLSNLNMLRAKGKAFDDLPGMAADLAASTGSIQQIRCFGANIEQNILTAVAKLKSEPEGFLLIRTA